MAVMATTFTPRGDRLDLFGGLHAVELGHDDVHERHVDLAVTAGVLHGIDGFPPIAGLCHDTQASVGLQEGLEPLTHEAVIVGNEDVEYQLAGSGSHEGCNKSSTGDRGNSLIRRSPPARRLPDCPAGGIHLIGGRLCNRRMNKAPVPFRSSSRVAA
jgi:hypothetical protein